MMPKKRTSKVVTVPAPIGGWNARAPLSDMQAIDAIILDNCFCLPSEIQIRKGYTTWSTGLAGTTESIFEYKSATATKLFAASNNAGACQIYDVTASGLAGVAVVGSLTSARFKTSNFSNSGGSYMHACNGANDLLLFDGSNWTALNGTSTPALTGVTTSTLVDVVTHKRRQWFVEKNTLHGWYLAVDAVAGAATKYDFGPIFKRGGKLVKVDTWTLDAGYGVDDMLVLFTSEGEVAVYRGTDPASASTWELTGVFYIGAPVGDVATTCKYGGDLLVVNRDGIAQLSKSLMSSRVSTHLQMTDKIQPRLAADISTYYSIYGWQVLLFPPQNMLLVNVPHDATTSYQYTMNTTSGGWSRWKGLAAKCWCFSGENLFFGAAGGVNLAWYGQNDNGSTVSATILPAYLKFGSDGQLKRWNMARVIYGLDASANFGAKMKVDFDLNEDVVATPAMVPANIGIWDADVWDGPIWGGSIYPAKRWLSVSGLGYWGSLQVKLESMNADIRVYSIDYNVEGGAVL